MSASHARAVVAGLRAHGIRVDEHPGCYSRGNGQQFANDGAPSGTSVHHTGAAFGGGFDLLVNGRPDLSGPLTNMCTWPDGHVTLIAAFPANHAGAGAGRSMGPLPRTSSFNRHMWGNEVMYPGSQPMTDAQMRTSQIMAGVVCGILKRSNPEWARGHAETSSTGKWDPGYAPGKTIDLGKWRAGIWPALNAGAVPAPSGPPAEGMHTVVSGDTLWGLAQRYRATVDALRAWNSWIRADIIEPGQRVRVAAPAPVVVAPAPPDPNVHIVVAGDTLYSLARRFGVTVDALKGANALGTDVLGIGQRLRIPAPTPEAPRSATAPPAPPPAPSAAGGRSAADALRDGGIVADPIDVIAATQSAGLELAVWAAALGKESYGGRNVFGNDHVDYPPSGPYTADTVDVTEPAYLAYRDWRRAAPGRLNGVGPAQLTWHAFQDQADALGGCWIPRHNMTVGAVEMARCVRSGNGDIAEAGARYNGGDRWRDAAAAKREHAESYGRDLLARTEQWRERLAGAVLPEVAPIPSPPAPQGPAGADIVAALRNVTVQLTDYLSRRP